MRATLLTFRILGLIAGAWLIVSGVLGTWQLFSATAEMLPSSSSFDPGALALQYYAPAVLLGVLLLLPWSRIRSRTVWFIAFALLVTASAAYLWRLFLPYSTAWRPSVLLDQGILAVLLAITAFLVLQIVAIALLRHSKANGVA